MEEISQEIYKELGQGHRECVYHRAFEMELRNRGIPYECEVVVPIYYKGQFLSHMRLDLVVEKSTIIELKAVKNIKGGEEVQQLKRYLKATGFQTGYLVNFGPDEVQVKQVTLSDS